MAKNSFILDATRGSVGNIVVRRSGGRTILSAKPTEVANPKTWAQAEVRMRMAAVSTFYSPLADYLAKGVQGKTRVDSQGQLTRDNIRLMKENMMGVYKGYGWAPLPLWLTKGSKPEVQVDVDYDENEHYINIACRLLAGELTSGISTVGALARYLQAFAGITAEEMQLTIVLALDGYYPVAERWQLSTASTAAVSSLNTSRIRFEEGSSGDTEYQISILPNRCVGIGVILTAWDGRRWLRTNSRLHVSPYVMDGLMGDAPYYQAVTSYMDSQDYATPEGDVWLDGYSRRAGGGGGGGGSLYPWSEIPVFISDARVQGVTITGPAIVSQGGNQLVGVTLSDGRTLAVTGDERSTNYGKGITQAGEAVSVEGLGTTGVQFGTASSLELAANLSVYYNIPLSVFFG